MFSIIWIVVGLLIASFGLFQLGRTGHVDYCMLVVVGIVWPIVLGLAIVLSPFVGIYYLGRLLRE